MLGDAVFLSTQLLTSFFLLIVSLFVTILFTSKNSINVPKKPPPSSSSSHGYPRSYPLIGNYFAIYANRQRRVEWLSDMIKLSPSSTFVLHRFFGQRQIFTGNPSNVHHILKTHFNIYPKGELLRQSLHDFLGDGIFNVNGGTWKFQRQVSSYEFNRRSLQKFVEHVVDAELSDRLLPILSSAAADGAVLDLQDILQRFTFDNICKIAFGYDPAYLLPSLPETRFAKAFEEAVLISSGRLNSMLPLVWKLKKLLCIGSEKQLKEAVSHVRGFARELIRKKKEKIKNSELGQEHELDILSRFLTSGQYTDEDFAIDIVISYIHAGRDTTSAALTWFFWLISKNPRVEAEIIKEINEKTGFNSSTIYEETKDMVYTHASLCESMRLYPPVPVDTKEATTNDTLPDGTRVRKGTRVVYHPYAMGRLPELWGRDWPEFKPERWLQSGCNGCVESGDGRKWGFVSRDPYVYPVFQAGPRICLGKEMAFLQMKRVVAAVLRRFRVVPAVGGGGEPVYFADLTSKMKGGFPVRIEEKGAGQSSVC